MRLKCANTLGSIVCWLTVCKLHTDSYIAHILLISPMVWFFLLVHGGAEQGRFSFGEGGSFSTNMILQIRLCDRETALVCVESESARDKWVRGLLHEGVHSVMAYLDKASPGNVSPLTRSQTMGFLIGVSRSTKLNVLHRSPLTAKSFMSVRNVHRGKRAPYCLCKNSLSEREGRYDQKPCQKKHCLSPIMFYTKV